MSEHSAPVAGRVTSPTSKSYWFSGPLRRFAVKVTTAKAITLLQEEVIVGARCGSLLYKLTKLVHTLYCILISFFSISACIPNKTCKIWCIMLQTVAFYSTFMSRYSPSFAVVTPSIMKSTFLSLKHIGYAPSIYRGQTSEIAQKRNMLCISNDVQWSLRGNK